MFDMLCSRHARLVAVISVLLLGVWVAAPAALQPAAAGGQSAQAAPAAQSPSPRGRRSEPGASRSGDRGFPWHQRPHPADGGPGRVRGRARVRPGDLHAAQEPARAQVDAGHLRAHLRDLQDVSHHARQVHPAPRALHRRDHGDLLRRAPAHGRAEGRRHSALQPHRHRRQLRRGVVRHPRQHVRQLARRVRRPGRHAVSDLRHPAQRRDEHRHAAHQRRAAADALHPALHSRRLRRGLLHRLRDRRVARRLRAQNRRRHLHEDRRHRLGPDEDRLQHQGRRRAQSRRHRRLHGRQRGRLGRAERRRLRDLRRDRCRAHLVHPGGGDRTVRPGAAPRLDLRDARRHDRRERRVVPAQRRVGEGELRRRQDDELRGAADPPGVADVDCLGHPHLRGLVLAHPDPRWQRQSLVAALDRHHLRHAGGGDHSRARQGLHIDRVQPREGGRDLVAGGRSVAQHPLRVRGGQFQRLLARHEHRGADGDRLRRQHLRSAGQQPDDCARGVRVRPGRVRVPRDGAGDDCGRFVWTRDRQRPVGVRALDDRIDSQHQAAAEERPTVST